MEQAWVVAFGAGDPAHDAQLFATMAANHPQWAAPGVVDQASGTTVGYWPVAAWAQARAGDPSGAHASAAAIRSAAVNAGRPWPFTPADAGQLLVLAGS